MGPTVIRVKNDDKEDRDKDEEETLDELDYDETIASAFLDSVYEKTRHIPEFQQLYDLAAACMFSTDREIGMAVLFSYDYFGLFHSLLEHMRTNATTPLTTLESYRQLLQRLSR